MTILGLDVGSSSVKAGILRNGRVIGSLARGAYPTRFDGQRAEIDPDAILRAIAKAVADLGSAARRVDAIGLSVMSPAWVAMDSKGKPLTPVITHQDRRSVQIAHDLERRIGKQRYLRITGNLPIPGGISATTARWYVVNHPQVIRRADLIGHLNTFLHRQITGRRVIDPSNASFTGLYETVEQGGWNPRLCRATGIALAKLPDVLEANVVPGCVTREAAHRFNFAQGTPVMTGIIDTSSAMLLTGARTGQLLNVMGSTDVLALCADRAKPHENLLTRALGIGKRWMSVGTLAAGGSTLTWAHRQLFCDLSDAAFFKLVGKLAHKTRDETVTFDPYLAGERTSIDQKQAAFHGLTLSTTREQMLQAIIDALAKVSGARLNLLRSLGVRMLTTLVISGGAARDLRQVMHRDWRGRWRIKYEDEASLRGLSTMEPREL